MSNSVAFHSQLASIMEVLANAAVAEICELVDNGYAVLNVEISRSQKENDVLKRKLRLMELKVARTSALRAGMGSSIFANSRSRSHLGFESRRTPSSRSTFAGQTQFQTATDPQLTTRLCRDAVTSSEAGLTTTQGLPVSFEEVKPKSSVIKEERVEEDWENGDQQESLRALGHSADGGERDSGAETGAAQPISKQETEQGNSSSCLWLSGDTDNSLISEPKTLNANKGPQNLGLETCEEIQDRVGFDCMLYEPPSQHGSLSTQGPEDPSCSYSVQTSVDITAAHLNEGNGFAYNINTAARSIAEHKQPVGYRDERQRALLPSDETQMTVRKNIGSGASLMRNGWVSQDSYNTSSSCNRDSSGGKLFICNFCGKTLACLKNLKTHLRVHTGEKPFCCVQCGKRFSDSSNLKRHQSVHTGERRYGCTHCGKRFAQSGSLKVHMSVHTGFKQFRCPHCGKTFISANHLKRHISVHDGEKVTPSTFQ